MKDKKVSYSLLMKVSIYIYKWLEHNGTFDETYTDGLHGMSCL